MTVGAAKAGLIGSLVVGETPTLQPAARGRILVIDDEQRIRSFVSRGLTAEGYLVESAADGLAGLDAVQQSAFDLVILDLMLPGLSGIEVLRRLVSGNPEQQVIVLSALSDTASKVSSLDLGAQDYLAKPFSIAELVARVHARIRDSRLRAVHLVAGGYTLDLIRREAHGFGAHAALAEREFLLLRELMGAAGTTVSKEQLLAAVWGYRFDPGSNVVDVYVRRVRAKLGTDSIKTIRGEGYRVDSA